MRLQCHQKRVLKMLLKWYTYLKTPIPTPVHNPTIGYDDFVSVKDKSTGDSTNDSNGTDDDVRNQWSTCHFGSVKTIVGENFINLLFQSIIMEMFSIVSTLQTNTTANLGTTASGSATITIPLPPKLWGFAQSHTVGYMSTTLLFRLDSIT